MSVLSPDRNFVVQAGSLILHGEFPSPRQETEIEIKVRRRLGGLSDDVLDPDVVGRERIMCELEVAVTHASDPDFLPALRGEGLPSDALLVAAWDPYVKAKKEHFAAEEKKFGRVTDLLTRESTILDLYLFHRTGRLPGNQDPLDLSLPRKRFLVTALSLLGNFEGIEERARMLHRLHALKSSRGLDILPDGMVYRLMQFGIDPKREAENRRRLMIRKLERDLWE